VPDSNINKLNGRWCSKHHKKYPNTDPCPHIYRIRIVKRLLLLFSFFRERYKRISIFACWCCNRTRKVIINMNNHNNCTIASACTTTTTHLVLVSTPTTKTLGVVHAPAASCSSPFVSFRLLLLLLQRVFPSSSPSPPAPLSSSVSPSPAAWASGSTVAMLSDFFFAQHHLFTHMRILLTQKNFTCQSTPHLLLYRLASVDDKLSYSRSLEGTSWSSISI
jgi:hypothetical protein